MTRPFLVLCLLTFTFTLCPLPFDLLLPGAYGQQLALPFQYDGPPPPHREVTPLTDFIQSVSSLVQYNSSNTSLSTNARMRWEYLPGSELFVVYNEGRDTHSLGAPDLQNRSFVIKINRLVRF